MNLMDFPSTNSSVIHKTGLSFNNLAYILNTTLFIMISTHKLQRNCSEIWVGDLQGGKKLKRVEKSMQFFTHSLYNMNSISYL